LSVCTCSVDSGRTAGTRPIKCRSVAPGVGKTEAPAIGLSKLNSMAFRLAAGTVRSMVGFAGRVTHVRRKTRFRPLVKHYRTGFPPAGLLRKVSDLYSTFHPPFPSLLCAITSTGAANGAGTCPAGVFKLTAIYAHFLTLRATAGIRLMGQILTQKFRRRTSLRTDPQYGL